MENLGFRASDIHGAGLNATKLEEQLSGWLNVLPTLRMGTLGAAGEFARTRHNKAREAVNDKLFSCTSSLQRIAGGLHSGADTYVTASDKALQAVLKSRSKVTSGWYADDDKPPELKGPQWQGAGLPALAVVLMAEKRKIRSELAYRVGRSILQDFAERGQIEFANLAKRSQATLRLLKTAAAMSWTAWAGVAVWLSVVSWHDEDLNDAMVLWRQLAGELAQTFAAGDPFNWEQLTQSWSGQGKNAADLRLRDFLVAGMQLADKVAGRSQGLEEAVKRLNEVHDWAFKITVGELALLAGLEAVKFLFPTAKLASAVVGRRLTLVLVAVQAVVVGILATLAYQDAGQDSAGLGPSGVEEVDFPFA
ncbi:hypothetical protein ABT294_32460 [Nonomuraea sp. NPDC000554]|uniref:hypothetical protein n=1 Tax=Nonomuraea sp. NPDC000554 TaxID=3154259 RepID=UPI0033172E2D